jgi:hypothetical protein
MSPRPGRIVADVAVALPRPRRTTDTAFQSLRAQLLQAMDGAA